MSGLRDWRQRLGQIWQQLDLAQRSYLISSLLVLGWFLSFNTQHWLLGLLGISLFSAVIADIWQGFLRIWHSLPGKAFILVCYAVLANFCFALADNTVNNLIGVRPEVVPFSVNLTLMLLAPFWSFLLAFVLLTAYLVLHTIKLLLMLLLRPLGVRSHHLQDGSYPKLSLTARLCFLPVVFIYMGAAMTGYLTGDTTAIDIFNDPEAVLTASAQTEAPTNPAPAKAEDPTAAQTTSEVEVKMLGSKAPEFSGFNPDVRWINRSVAWFIYQVESLNKSQCRMEGAEHLVHLNDYEVLVITPDDTQPYGYRYQVRACGSLTGPVPRMVP